MSSAVADVNDIESRLAAPSADADVGGDFWEACWITSLSGRVDLVDVMSEHGARFTWVNLGCDFWEWLAL